MANGDAINNVASPAIFQEAQRIQSGDFTPTERKFFDFVDAQTPRQIDNFELGKTVLLRRLGAAARGETFRDKPLPGVDSPGSLLAWFVDQAGKSPPKI